MIKHIWHSPGHMVMVEILLLFCYELFKDEAILGKQNCTRIVIEKAFKGENLCSASARTSSRGVNLVRTFTFSTKSSQLQNAHMSSWDVIINWCIAIDGDFLCIKNCVCEQFKTSGWESYRRSFSSIHQSTNHEYSTAVMKSKQNPREHKGL